MIIKELLALVENDVKAYKLDAPHGISEEDLWKWVEDQDVVTIENIEKKGDKLYVYPHFGDKYSDETLKKLQRSLSAFDFEEIDESAKVTEASDADIEKIVAEIGKKHNVDFQDADGSAAKSAMVACYKRGLQDGFNS